MRFISKAAVSVSGVGALLAQYSEIREALGVGAFAAPVVILLGMVWVCLVMCNVLHRKD